MNFLRKAIAIIITCLLFAGLAVVSIIASLIILAAGIILMVWVRYQKPEIFRPQSRPSNIIEGEYRVIETTRIIEKTETEVK